MRGLLCAGIVAATAMMPWHALAAMHWEPAPPKHQGHSHVGHDRNAAKMFAIDGGNGASLALLKPDLSQSPLTAERGEVKVVPTGMDNYHALIASRITGALHETAIRYFYLHGKPSGNSPSQLAAALKSTLEIEPAPLPREHWRYMSGESARFLLRFMGAPLAGVTVSMTTSNGTSVESTSDADGYLSFELPDDFPAVKPGRSGNVPSQFVLTASHGNGAEQFVTTLSSEYFVNPSHWQSLPLGAATAFGGMLLGGLLTFRNLRRRGK